MEQLSREELAKAIAQLLGYRVEVSYPHDRMCAQLFRPDGNWVKTYWQIDYGAGCEEAAWSNAWNVDDANAALSLTLPGWQLSVYQSFGRWVANYEQDAPVKRRKNIGAGGETPAEAINRARLALYAKTGE